MADFDVLVGPAGVCRDEHVDDRSVRALCALVTLAGVPGTVRADGCLLVSPGLQPVWVALAAGRSWRQPRVSITGVSAGVCA